MNAAVAGQLIEDMWEDLNNVDEAVPPNAEVKANPYRKEKGFPFT